MEKLFNKFIETYAPKILGFIWLLTLFVVSISVAILSIWWLLSLIGVI